MCLLHDVVGLCCLCDVVSSFLCSVVHVFPVYVLHAFSVRHCA